ncbi:telomere-protecting terminal protein Tpg [Streptomyces sp. NPDC097727]|uniref:telomere-protecting terminal protein Tpg n=1 Tax=Streptomyces sp. NPDC097727 TaxID=3366092 RepID=UPI00380B0778
MNNRSSQACEPHSPGSYHRSPDADVESGSKDTPRERASRETACPSPRKTSRNGDGTRRTVRQARRGIEITRQKAATTGGIVIDTRARMGYTAPIGSTDQDRIRHLTVALPPIHAARLFDAQEAGASDAQLQEIAAEALKEVYFQDSGRRAGSLEEVRFTDVEHLEFDV